MSNTNSTEVRNALRRYNTMVDRNPTATAWRAIAVRLWAASHSVTGDYVNLVRDRAHDPHSRADSMRLRRAS